MQAQATRRLRQDLPTSRPASPVHGRRGPRTHGNEEAGQRPGRRSRVVSSTVALLLALATTPATATAANLLSGTSFDSPADLTTYWGNLGPHATWSALDVDGLSSSGSVLLSNTNSPGSAILIFSACVPIDPGKSYRFAAWHLTPGPQLATGFARVAVQWRESCPLGAFTGSDASSGASQTIGAWTELEGLAQAPLTAGGARLYVEEAKLTGLATDPFDVYFDEVFLPEPTGGATAAVVALLAVRARRSVCARGARRERRP